MKGMWEFSYDDSEKVYPLTPLTAGWVSLQGEGREGGAGASGPGDLLSELETGAGRFALGGK